MPILPVQLGFTQTTVRGGYDGLQETNAGSSSSEVAVDRGVLAESLRRGLAHDARTQPSGVYVSSRTSHSSVDEGFVQSRRASVASVLARASVGRIVVILQL